MATVQAWSTAQNGLVEIDQDRDLVYIVNTRTGEYQQQAHRIAHVVNGTPVTFCRVWARGGLVYSEQSDSIGWCRWGCRTRETLSAPEAQ
jgi:hypothetical protein